MQRALSLNRSPDEFKDVVKYLIGGTSAGEQMITPLISLVYGCTSKQSV